MAKQDLDVAVRDYATIRPELANRFINEVNARFDRILHDPLRWRIVSGSVHRVLTKVFPFALLYVIEGDVASVVVVAHNSREPGYSMDRTPH